MTLDEKTVLLSQQVGADIGNLLKTVGSVANLQTLDKTSLVAALNELVSDYNAILVHISDEANRLDDSKVTENAIWSVNKIMSQISITKDMIIAGSPEAYDTLKKITDYLHNNDNEVTTLINFLSGTIRFDEFQNLNAQQKLQATTNINIGDSEQDLRLIYWLASDTNNYVQPGYTTPGYVE